MPADIQDAGHGVRNLAGGEPIGRALTSLSPPRAESGRRSLLPLTVLFLLNLSSPTNSSSTAAFCNSRSCQSGRNSGASALAELGHYFYFVGHLGTCARTPRLSPSSLPVQPKFPHNGLAICQEVLTPFCRISYFTAVFSRLQILRLDPFCLEMIRSDRTTITISLQRPKKRKTFRRWRLSVDAPL